VSSNRLDRRWISLSATLRQAHVHERVAATAIGMDYDGGFHQDEAMRLRAVLASSAASIALAAPVHADPDPDQIFLAALNNAGITYHSGPDAVATGRRACQLMDQGARESDVVTSMAEQNKGFTTDAARKFTRIAETTYCPGHTFGETPPPPTWNPLPEFPWPALPPAL
jgi:hypothetical protein